MVNFKEDEQLKMLNHSCAHLMAQAIKHLYPPVSYTHLTLPTNSRV